MTPSSISAWLHPVAIVIAIGLAWLVRINVVTYRAFAGQLRRIAVAQAMLLVVAAIGLFVIAAPAEAASNDFACVSPSHHDGDAIRCRGENQSMRLYGIDAPEMPGACRPGRCDARRGTPMPRATIWQPDPGPRRHLRTRSIPTAMIAPSCAAPPMDPTSAARWLAMARRSNDMAGSTAAVRLRRRRTGGGPGGGPDGGSGGGPGWGGSAPAEEPEKRYYAPRKWRPPWISTGCGSIVPLWLIFHQRLALDRHGERQARALDQIDARFSAFPKSTLLLLAAAGGSPATVAAQRELRHKSRKQPFGASAADSSPGCRSASSADCCFCRCCRFEISDNGQ